MKNKEAPDEQDHDDSDDFDLLNLTDRTREVKLSDELDYFSLD